MRKHYLDNIRWMTVVLVVVYHIFYLFNGIVSAGVVGPFAPVQYQDAVQYLLYPWFMVLLFIVSGMSARYDLDKRSGRAFARSRTRRLLVPSTVALLVFHWMQGYISMELSGAFATMPAELPGPVLYLIMCLSGTGVLWYIQMLWIFSMALLLVRRMEKGRLLERCGRVNWQVWMLLPMGIAMWAAAQVLNTPIIAVYRFGIYGLAFFLGYFVFTQEKLTDCLAHHAVWLGIAAAALGVVYMVTAFGTPYPEAPWVNAPLPMAYMWLACLAIIGGMKRWGDRTCPAADFMRRRCWALYLFHYLPLSACGLVLTRYTALPPVVIYLLCAVSAFAGALVLGEIVSRIPVLRWVVMGIKKERIDHVQG